MSEQRLRPKQAIAGTVDALRYYKGEFAADIFATAASLYPSFANRLAGVHIAFVQEPGFVYQGRSDIAESIIKIGPASTEGVSPWLATRLQKRFGIAPELLQHAEIGASVLQAVGEAHELGHNLQDSNSQMQRFFGTIIPDKLEGEGDVVADLHDPEAYITYVNSASEVNADYIARTILANSEIGEILGITLPEQAPAQWAKWAQDHAVTQQDLQ